MKGSPNERKRNKERTFQTFALRFCSSSPLISYQPHLVSSLNRASLVYNALSSYTVMGWGRPRWLSSLIRVMFSVAYKTSPTQSSLCVFRKEISLTLELEVTPRFTDRSGLALDPSNWITELICYQNEIRSTASLLLSPNEQEKNANEFLFHLQPLETCCCIAAWNCSLFPSFFSIESNCRSKWER